MPERFTFSQVQDYTTTLVPQRPSELQKMEAYAKEHGFPIIGPAAGQLCYLLARMIEAQRIFEMGSGYGYSTAWFARAVQENTENGDGGIVHHTVWDDKLSQMAQQHLSSLGYSELVQYHVAEAVETLKNTDGPFDLIFNDIDKEAYPESLPVIRDKLRTGGLLIIDNMLMGGAILEANNASASVAGTREFTRLITTSPDWIVTMIPIRDGLIIAQKVA